MREGGDSFLQLPVAEGQRMFALKLIAFKLQLRNDSYSVRGESYLTGCFTFVLKLLEHQFCFSAYNVNIKCLVKGKSSKPMRKHYQNGLCSISSNDERMALYACSGF